MSSDEMTDNYPLRAKQSCFLFLKEFEDEESEPGCLPARVDREQAIRFAETIDVEEVKARGSSLANDHNKTQVSFAFTSVEQEAAAIVFLHALDFGGGWRRELHEHTGQGAFITVKAGVEALIELSPHLEADWLTHLEPSTLATAFGLADKPPLAPLVAQLTQVCQELGVRLVASEYSQLSDLVVSFLSRSSDQRSAASLVRLLVDHFPFTFNDAYQVRDRSVCFYKKAQLVVGELYHRFRSFDPRFNFADADLTLTAFIDNVICACLRKEKVVVCRPALQEAIENNVPLSSGSEEEVSLRAAAMVGIETIIAAVSARYGGRSVLTSVEMGNYLWGYLGKTPEFRTFPRHAIHNTVFY